MSRFRHAKSEPGKDARSPLIERDTGATEDEAWRCFAAAEGRARVAGWDAKRGDAARRIDRRSRLALALSADAERCFRGVCPGLGLCPTPGEGGAAGGSFGGPRRP